MHEEFCINCYKIILKKGIYCKKLLSPLARAEWIEISMSADGTLTCSLRSRERSGLKFLSYHKRAGIGLSPLARAEWIEI